MAIVQRSPILKEMIKKNEIALIGGLYDIDTRVIDFYNDDIVTADTIVRVM